MSIIVVVLKGKGDFRADELFVKLFDNKKDAEGFCADTTNLVSKYWTSCVIVNECEVIDTYAND
jgi:hypothetical protein